MSKIEMPIALKKHKKFIADNIHLSECDSNHVFFEILNKMDASEEIYTFMKRKYKDVNSQLDDLNIGFIEMVDRHFKKVEEIEQLIKFDQTSRGKQRRNESRLVSCNAELYSNIGKILNDFGILESLLNRSNNNFSKVNASFLRINLEQALEEFDTFRNQKTTNAVITMKIAFYINKIVKYMDDMEYGEMLESDTLKAKSQNDSRIKFLSKLKTDYLKKVWEANINLNDDDSTVLFASQQEYEQLFGNDFENLNFEEDLKKVAAHEFRKKIFYIHKGGFINQSFLTLMGSDPNKQLDRDIKSWGICEDGKGGYVFGMNLYSYPMPLTGHIQKQKLTRAIEICKTNRMNLGIASKVNTTVPKYKTLYTPSQKVFTTNLLFQATEVQRSRIKHAYESEPDNECLKFFYDQISGRGFDRKGVEEYSFNDLI